MAQTEKQKYSLLYKQGDFEIRRYEPAILASVEMPGTYSSMSSSGFRELAGYIFGGNNREMKIAMTAPVRVATEDSTSTMSFVMPSAYQMKDLPEPLSEKVWLHKSGSLITASVSFGGYANDRIINRKIEELKGVLESKYLEYRDDFQFLGYDPPYRFINRRNEVLVPIINY
jgi:hypothetical protein